MEEKFKVGDIVSFDVFGTELKGTGEILGKAMNGLCSMWIVLLKDRYTEEMMDIEQKALLIQENFMEILRRDVISEAEE